MKLFCGHEMLVTDPHASKMKIENPTDSTPIQKLEEFFSILTQTRSSIHTSLLGSVGLKIKLIQGSRPKILCFFCLFFLFLSEIIIH